MTDHELWDLCKEAHQEYLSAVVKGQVCYRRFVNDFLSYHLPVPGHDIAAWRAHLRNLVRMRDLFNYREDLVRQYFSRATYTEEDHGILLQLLFKGLPVPGQAHPDTKNGSLCRFTGPQLSMLTHFINAERMFEFKVSEEQVDNLFTCTRQAPLKARNNSRIILLLSSLRMVGFLPLNWQKIVEENSLITSSKDGALLTASRMSSNLSYHRRNDEDNIRYKRFANMLKNA